MIFSLYRAIAMMYLVAGCRLGIVMFGVDDQYVSEAQVSAVAFFQHILNFVGTSLLLSFDQNMSSSVWLLITMLSILGAAKREKGKKSLCFHFF